jgi:hypothetical protein
MGKIENPIDNSPIPSGGHSYLRGGAITNAKQIKLKLLPCPSFVVPQHLTKGAEAGRYN